MHVTHKDMEYVRAEQTGEVNSTDFMNVRFINIKHH